MSGPLLSSALLVMVCMRLIFSTFCLPAIRSTILLLKWALPCQLCCYSPKSTWRLVVFWGHSLQTILLTISIPSFPTHPPTYPPTLVDHKGVNDGRRMYLRQQQKRNAPFNISYHDFRDSFSLGVVASIRLVYSSHYDSHELWGSATGERTGNHRTGLPGGNPSVAPSILRSPFCAWTVSCWQNNTYYPSIFSQLIMIIPSPLLQNMFGIVAITYFLQNYAGV